MADMTATSEPAAAALASGPAILSVENLSVSFRTPQGVVSAVNGVDYSVARGETVAILGESGSGKSVSVGAVMGLLESPPAEIRGKILCKGLDVLKASPEEARTIRGNRIAMVYQDAVTSLNPGLTVGYQLAEMFHVHRPGTSRRDALNAAENLLDRVKIPSARQRLK
ncbi:MAG: ATP-binding cassette domain-containing protein, partial [Pseudomonadota bacterium]